MSLQHVMAVLYDREIVHGIECVWDSGWLAWIEDGGGRRHERQFSRQDVDQIGPWLLEEAKRRPWLQVKS